MPWQKPLLESTGYGQQWREMKDHSESVHILSAQDDLTTSLTAYTPWGYRLHIKYAMGQAMVLSSTQMKLLTGKHCNAHRYTQNTIHPWPYWYTALKWPERTIPARANHLLSNKKWSLTRRTHWNVRNTSLFLYRRIAITSISSLEILVVSLLVYIWTICVGLRRLENCIDRENIWNLTFFSEADSASHSFDMSLPASTIFIPLKSPDSHLSFRNNDIGVEARFGWRSSLIGR